MCRLPRYGNLADVVGRSDVVRQVDRGTVRELQRVRQVYTDEDKRLYAAEQIAGCVADSMIAGPTAKERTHAKRG